MEFGVFSFIAWLGSKHFLSPAFQVPEDSIRDRWLVDESFTRLTLLSAVARPQGRHGPAQLGRDRTDNSRQKGSGGNHCSFVAL